MLQTILKTIVFGVVFTCAPINSTLAGCDDCECEHCCDQKGGIRYSDSSAGRYVCNNGDYSVCYSTRHAIMDMQKFAGCCMWKGGVLKTTPRGIVLCRNGDYSEICSIDNMSR